MPDATHEPDPGTAGDPVAGTPGPGARFEVILDDPGAAEPEESAESVAPAGPGARAAAAAAARIAQISALDLDRLPDREHVRLLVDAEQLDRLRAAGMPVRVRRAVPIAPLDPALIAADDDVAGWLAARLGPAEPPGGEG